MKVYGNVTLSEGSNLSNLTVVHGDTFPLNPNIGEIFYHDEQGLSCYNGTIWEPVINEILDKSIDDIKLSNTGVTPGTYSSVTVNSAGRVTAGESTSVDIINELGYTPLNKAGDSMTGNLSMPADHASIKIENQFGWKDLIGDVAGKNSGTASPQQKTLFSSVRGWAYAAGDQGDLLFHVPHDYAPGTDMFLHFHWTHNGTNISGALIISCNVTYATGHQMMSFSDPINPIVSIPDLNITNTPKLMHRIDEIQLTSAGGGSNHLNSSIIEVDGIILISFTASTIPSISGSITGNNVPFLLSADLHYQTTSLPTKNKSPNFYL